MGALLWAYVLRRVVRARTAALTESETRYTLLFNAAADPVLVLDADGKITAAEFAGVDAKFAEIDTDNDGAISTTEAAAYARAQRLTADQTALVDDSLSALSAVVKQV